MVTGPEVERKQLLSTKTIVETLLSKIKEFQISLDNLRQRREINVGTSRVLEEAVSSAFVVAANLKTTLSPFWTPDQSNVAPHEPETPIELSAEMATSCGRCGRGVNAEFRLCPYCGYELRPRSCQECGKEVLAEFRFCPHCGNRSEKTVMPGQAEVHPEIRDLR
jgi:RNA polymerase subunit RPABC4/transcription elongation factor Spt4